VGHGKVPGGPDGPGGAGGLSGREALRRLQRELSGGGGGEWGGLLQAVGEEMQAMEAALRGAHDREKVRLS
jgi:hypothetical protein